MLKNKIVLVGKGGSGKDFMRKKLEGRGFIYAVSYTSRPARVNEVEGNYYYFLSKSRFMEHISEGFFYEYVEFNGWIYGTANWQMDECDIFIMTPSGIRKLHAADRKSSFIICIDIPRETRKARLTERNDTADSIDRRLDADDRDFEGFNDFDIVINNENF